MLQLPHVDMDAIKKLSRRRVRGLGDLLELPPEERLAALHSCGGHPFPPCLLQLTWSTRPSIGLERRFLPALSAAAHVANQAKHWPGKTCGSSTRSRLPRLLASVCHAQA